MTRSTLESLVDKVHEDHCLRSDIPLAENLVPRPFKRRPRPKTAIIAMAAQARVGIVEVIRRAQQNNVGTTETTT